MHLRIGVEKGAGRRGISSQTAFASQKRALAVVFVGGVRRLLSFDRALPVSKLALPRVSRARGRRNVALSASRRRKWGPWRAIEEHRGLASLSFSLSLSRILATKEGPPFFQCCALFLSPNLSNPYHPSLLSASTTVRTHLCRIAVRGNRRDEALGKARRESVEEQESKSELTRAKVSFSFFKE